MRRLAAFIVAAFAMAASAVSAATWYRPDRPGDAPVVLDVAEGGGLSALWVSAMTAQGYAVARWNTAFDDIGSWSVLLDDAAGIDRSRVLLMASGDAVTTVLRASQAGERNATPFAGWMLRIERAVEWPVLADRDIPAAVWLSYDPADRDGRNAAFVLARRARAAGAQVWLQPHADDTAAALMQAGDWLPTLDVPRARRFEDANVTADRSAGHDARVVQMARLPRRRDDDRWLASVVEGDGTIDLVHDLAGRISRRDGQGLTMEFDASAALATVFGGVAELQIGPAMAVALRHPETGAKVWAFAARHGSGDDARSVLLLRHGGGSYALLDLNDTRKVLAVQPSDDSRDRGRVWWVLMDRADARGSRIVRVALQTGVPSRGFWWDPSHVGHGIDVTPVGAGYRVLFSTFDDNGEPRWYRADGTLSGGRFVVDGDGLKLMRRDPAVAAAKADPNLRGRIAIDFTIDAQHPICRRRHATATQLALLTVTLPQRTSSWCIEPVALPDGVPDADVNGLWSGGASDAGWNLSVSARGDGDQRLMSAMLYGHDADGWPRWAMGAVRAGEHGAVVPVQVYRKRCADCETSELVVRPAGEVRLRAAGWCAQPELRAAIAVRNDDLRLSMRRDEMPLLPTSRPACP